MRETQLTAVLKSRGLRLIDFAEIVDINKATATRWSYSGIPLKKLDEVSKAVGIPREELRPDFFKERA